MKYYRLYPVPMGPNARSSMAALAEDPTGTRLGLELPAGRIVADVEGAPILWLSDAAPDRDLLDDLHGRARRTGLWPVALNGEGFSQPVRPGWPRSPIDASAVLADWTARTARRGDDHDHLGCEACRAMIEYYRSRPGAAGRTASEVASLMLPHAPNLGLVGCDRSADIPTALGWDGPANDRHEIALYSAVLGRWEDQFGVRVIALQGAGLVCSVASPPTTYDQALELAAEQLAFCPDLAGEFESVNAHAAALVGVSMWTFWWD
jgi:hypothetical protein